MIVQRQILSHLVAAELSHGAVYVYKVDSSDPAHPWRLLQVLSSVQGENTYFGHSVGFTERTIVVGAVGYRSGEYLTHGHGTLSAHHGICRLSMWLMLANVLFVIFDLCLLVFVNSKNMLLYTF